tara:strand:- start:128 stop:970 length:843 start_codon:yes stop_codon:yes gene_type:complete
MSVRSVNIIVLNWNQKDLSLKCISSLEKTVYKDKHIVFVDNGSIDGSVESVKRLHPNVEIIELENNLGYAAGNNAGFSMISKKSKYTIFLNNDTFVDSSFIEPLIDELEDNTLSIQAVPKIFYAQEKGKVWYAGGDINLTLSQIRHIGIRSSNIEKYNKRSTVDYATGCCFCIRSDDFTRFGMFDENYKMYCEDVDLSLKISNNGGQIAYIPNSKVWHHVSMSLGGSNSYSKWSKKQLSILRLILKHGRLILLPISIISYFINASLSFMFISILKITKKR